MTNENKKRENNIKTKLRTKNFNKHINLHKFSRF